MQPTSLDALDLYERMLPDSVAAPALLLPGEDARRAQKAKHAQVEALLACLSPHQQQVIRLRFGLDEADGREHTYAEIARQLGVKTYTAKNMERYALARLRSLAAQEQAQLQRHCEARAKREQRARMKQMSEQERIAAEQAQAVQRQAEQEAHLASALARLEAQGEHIDMVPLAKAAKVDAQVAAAYLHTVWGTPEARLTHAYAQLQARGVKITVKLLSKAAKVRERTAGDFLNTQRGTVRQACSRRKRGLSEG